MNLDLVNKRLITLEEEFEKLKLYLEIEQLRFGEKLKYEFIIDRQLENRRHSYSIHDSTTLCRKCDLAWIDGFIKRGYDHCSMQPHSTKKKCCASKLGDDGIGINQSKKLNQQKSRKSFGIELTIDR